MEGVQNVPGFLILMARETLHRIQIKLDEMWINVGLCKFWNQEFFFFLQEAINEHFKMSFKEGNNFLISKFYLGVSRISQPLKTETTGQKCSLKVLDSPRELIGRQFSASSAPLNFSKHRQEPVKARLWHWSCREQSWPRTLCAEGDCLKKKTTQFCICWRVKLDFSPTD